MDFTMLPSDASFPPVMDPSAICVPEMVPTSFDTSSATSHDGSL